MLVTLTACCILTVVFDWTVLVRIDTEHSKFQLVSDLFLNEFWSCNLKIVYKFSVVSVVLHEQSLSYGMHLAFTTKAICVQSDIKCLLFEA